MKSEPEAPSFTLSSTVAEAWWNVRAHWLLATARGLTAVAVGFATMSVTLLQVTAIEERYAAGVQAGRFVLQATPGIPGRVLVAAQCDALAGAEGVVSAGAAQGAEEVSPQLQPLARYELVQITQGLPAVYWPGSEVSTPTGGLLVGSFAAENLGLVSGATVTLSFGDQPMSTATLRVDRVMPPSPREDSVDRRFFLVVPASEMTDECLVDTDPVRSRAVGQLLQSWFPSEAGVAVAPLRPLDSLSRTPEAELDDRGSTWAWPLGGAFLALTTLIIWYGRRAEAALYQVLGMSQPKLALMYGVEFTMLAVVPCQLGAVVGLAWVTSQADVPALAAKLAGLENVALLCALAVVPLLHVLGRRRRGALDSLKGG